MNPSQSLSRSTVIPESDPKEFSEFIGFGSPDKSLNSESTEGMLQHSDKNLMWGNYESPEKKKCYQGAEVRPSEGEGLWPTTTGCKGTLRSETNGNYTVKEVVPDRDPKEKVIKTFLTDSVDDPPDETNIFFDEIC